MITKRDLQRYRATKREVRDLMSRMRAAERMAKESGREEDRMRARVAAALYESAAAVEAERIQEIECAMERIEDPRVRQAIRYRYVDGLSRIATAMRMGCSDAAVDKWCARGIKQIVGGSGKGG